MNDESSKPQSDTSEDDSAMLSEIVEELKSLDEGDTETCLLAIVQSAVTDSTFSASTVKYMVESFGLGDLWVKAAELSKLDDELFDNDGEDLDELDDPDEPEM